MTIAVTVWFGRTNDLKDGTTSHHLQLCYLACFFVENKSYNLDKQVLGALWRYKDERSTFKSRICIIASSHYSHITYAYNKYSANDRQNTKSMYICIHMWICKYIDICI